MRGADEQQKWMFSYVSAKKRVPKDHPLITIRTMVDVILRYLSPRFERLCVKIGRPSITPEKLLRALLLQVLYSVRSERLLMEQLDYNLLFRWFVGNRTTRHARCPINQRKRKRVEEIFGRMKTVGMLRKTRHRGTARVGWMFTFGVAVHNLLRMRNLMEVPA